MISKKSREDKINMKTKIITDLYQMGLGIRRIADITNHKLSEVKKIIDVNKLVKYSSTYPKNFEFLTDFINRKDISPIKYQNKNILVLNRYYRKRVLIED